MRHQQKDIDLAAYAFYQGAHGMPLAETLKEIRAIHDNKRAKLREQSVRVQKPLEATIQQLERQRPQVDAAWSDIVRKLGIHAPSIVPALFMAALGFLALIVDAILLAPGLDAVGISDPGFQLIAAFGLSALSSVIFYLAHETFTPNAMPSITRIALRALGGITVLALLAWGTFRGLEVQFGASINQNPLGTFLAQHPVLATIFFCFITLAAPFAGAAAFHYAVPLIQEATAWKRAKADYERLHTELARATKKLEAELAAQVHQLDQLASDERNWHSVAAQHHERGSRNSTRQTPHWLILLKASLWGLGGLVAGCVTGPLLAPLYFALPVAAWTGSFLYYRQRRFHPSYAQFHRQENTQFAVSSDAPAPAQKPPMPLLRAPEDSQ